MRYTLSSIVRPALVLGAVVLLVACSPGAAEPTQLASVPEVRVVEAQAAASTVELTLPARADAWEAAHLHARATGFISAVHADLGDRVQQGQVLAVISAPESDQAVHEAKALLAKAQADEELACVNHERARALVGSGAISEALYSDRKAALDVAVAATGAARARLTAARERQNFQRVRAPFAGVVVARNVERGDRVVGDAAAATPLFEINSLDSLRLVIDVPQHVALQVREGGAGKVVFPELPGHALEAAVVRSAQALSKEAGVMRAELRLPNPGARLPAGMVGTVKLRVPRARPAVLVPTSAVVQRADGPRVATVETGILAYRKVVVGRNLGHAIEIVSGLAKGQQVVLSPNALLVSGTRVNVRRGPQTAAGGA